MSYTEYVIAYVLLGLLLGYILWMGLEEVDREFWR